MTIFSYNADVFLPIQAIMHSDYHSNNTKSLPKAPYLLVVQGIVNGVTQSRDKVWL